MPRPRPSVELDGVHPRVRSQPDRLPSRTAAAERRQAPRHRAGSLNDRLTTPSSPLRLRRPKGQSASSNQRITDDPGATGGLTSHGVAWWHTSLRRIAVLNVALWLLSALAVTREHASIPGETDAASYLQLLLSAGYVAGCAFRSFLPVVDIPRIVLVDSRLSSVLVGRSVATVAEVCFAAQWALVLHH